MAAPEFFEGHDFLVTVDVNDTSPDGSIFHLPIFLSDHRKVSLDRFPLTSASSVAQGFELDRDLRQLRPGWLTDLSKVPKPLKAA